MKIYLKRLAELLLISFVINSFQLDSEVENRPLASFLDKEKSQNQMLGNFPLTTPNHLVVVKSSFLRVTKS
jgi:hypothetical protein